VTLSDVFAGRACHDCGARAELEPWTPAWCRRDVGYARCVDRVACTARAAKRGERARLRASCLVLELPVVPDAPLGTCRWCGEALTGANGSRRNYCYLDREGRDCVKAWRRSRTWDARAAIRWRDRAEHGCVRCVDCNVVCEPEDEDASGVPWDADHELALEDGGEHVLENLRARCVQCHSRKTARENRARTALRRAGAELERHQASGQLTLLVDDAAEAGL